MFKACEMLNCPLDELALEDCLKFCAGFSTIELLNVF